MTNAISEMEAAMLCSVPEHSSVVKSAARYSVELSSPPFDFITSVTAANIANISLWCSLEGENFVSNFAKDMLVQPLQSEAKVSEVWTENRSKVRYFISFELQKWTNNNEYELH